MLQQTMVAVVAVDFMEMVATLKLLTLQISAAVVEGGVKLRVLQLLVLLVLQMALLIQLEAEARMGVNLR
jgi:hypothetical protein